MANNIKIKPQQIDYGSIPYDIQDLVGRVNQTASNFNDTINTTLPGIKMREEQERIKKEEQEKRDKMPWHSKLGYYLMTVPQDGSNATYSKEAADRLMVGDYAGAEAIQKPIDTAKAIATGLGSVGGFALADFMAAAGTYGVGHALAAETAASALGTAGWKGGEVLGKTIDKNFNTNTKSWLPWLTSFGGGIAGYKTGLKGASEAARFAVNNGIRGYSDFKPAVQKGLIKYIKPDYGRFSKIKNLLRLQRNFDNSDPQLAFNTSYEYPL